MFSEHKKKQEEAKKKDKNGDLIFDDLNAKTSNMKMAEERSQKEPKYMSEMEAKNPKRKSIKKIEQKASTMSLNLSKNGEKEKESVSSQRSNSLEAPALTGAPSQNVGLSIFEAATMMCNIVDITTDSTTKNGKIDKTKVLKSKESKTSLGSASGPFAQMKEAQEQKRKSKQSFELEDDDSDS
ncbi:unnamed protein product [Caenorhabditis sp. 36 PRJEB53466]|nr:unnamed protein product [Caenorhabditis sp. 36 PRJEB53466]